MVGQFVYELSSAQYEKKVLLFDDDNLISTTDTESVFSENGFDLVRFDNDIRFRIHYTDAMNDDSRIAVIAHKSDYIPFDILSRFHCFDVTYDALFPKLNTSALRKRNGLDLDILLLAYRHLFTNLQSESDTADFIDSTVYSGATINEFISIQITELKEMAERAESYLDWIYISKKKAKIDYMATKYNVIQAGTDFVNRFFKDFILTSFAKLSTEPTRTTPVLVSKAMEYMQEKSGGKFAVIVMDGMSEFDWIGLSESFAKASVPYDETSVLAMIPTTTSISRQCLLSGKYPRQLIHPWKQDKEEQEFKECASNMGYADNQIEYAHSGYDVHTGTFTKCLAVVINDIDDLVHGQTQERIGMLNDVSVLSDQKKLVKLVVSLANSGFHVFITADHGNTPCIGMGKVVGSGVEVETKSHKMLVLKDFADKEKLMEKFDLIEYPKYYLDKSFDYLICESGKSLDAKGESVITHGGISIDEVIVPFISIKAGKYHG